MALQLPSRLQEQPYKCPNPNCKNGQIFDWNVGPIDKETGLHRGGMVRCECQEIIRHLNFLDIFPKTPHAPYRNASFESLNPLDQNLIILGPIDNTWALIRGELGQHYEKLTVKVITSKDVAGLHVNERGDYQWGALVDVDLVIVMLTHNLNSPKINTMYLALLEARRNNTKALWFVAPAITSSMKQCYDPAFWKVLAQFHEINCLHYPSLSAATPSVSQPRQEALPVKESHEQMQSELSPDTPQLSQPPRPRPPAAPPVVNVFIPKTSVDPVEEKPLQDMKKSGGYKKTKKGRV